MARCGVRRMPREVIDEACGYPINYPNDDPIKHPIRYPIEHPSSSPKLRLVDLKRTSPTIPSCT